MAERMGCCVRSWITTVSRLPIWRTQGHHVSAATVQREADKGYSQDRVEKVPGNRRNPGGRMTRRDRPHPAEKLRDRYGDELETAFPGMTKSTFRLSGIIRQVQAYLRTRAASRSMRRSRTPPPRAGLLMTCWTATGMSGGSGNSTPASRRTAASTTTRSAFTPPGTSLTFKQTHYPVTLENIVKAMKGQNGGNTEERLWLLRRQRACGPGPPALQEYCGYAQAGGAAAKEPDRGADKGHPR